MGIIGSLQLLDASSDQDEYFVRSYERTLAVYATIDQDEAHVRAALPVAIGDPHPSDASALCKRIGVRLATPNILIYDNEDNPAGAVSLPADGTEIYLWEASISWGLFDPLTHTTGGDPITQPARVFFESEPDEEVCDVNTDGNPILTSAGSQFDPTVIRERTRPVLRVVRNEATFSDSTILAFADHVNLDVVGSYPARTLKCSAPTAERKFSQATGAIYYEVTYLLRFNPDTWDKQPLDAGYEMIDPSDPTKRIPILDDSGNRVSTPACLDGMGAPLAPPVDHTNVVYLNFKVYDEISFASSFGFGTGLFN